MPQKHRSAGNRYPRRRRRCGEKSDSRGAGGAGAIFSFNKRVMQTSNGMFARIDFPGLIKQVMQTGNGEASLQQFNY